MRSLLPCPIPVLLAGLLSQPVQAQTFTGSRLAIIEAENRRAKSPRDLATIRAGVRSRDSQTRLIAIRALGRLERPAFIADLLPALTAALPEVRAEAAAAIGQASQGWDAASRKAGSVTLDLVINTVSLRLKVETDADVRVALCDTIGRLPFAEAGQIERAEQTLVEAAGRGTATIDWLGPAKGLEALARRHQERHAPGREAIALLRQLVQGVPAEGAGGARVRRLALETLTRADAVDEPTVERALRDQDVQVRRLAVRAARSRQLSERTLQTGLTDEAAMVRIEALRSLASRGAEGLCPAAESFAAAAEVHVALEALDRLGACGASRDAVALLERTLTDLSEAGSPRAWHRTAHALVALARAAPERAEAMLPQFTGSTIWQLRSYAARAAALLKNRPALGKLAEDGRDNVREAAIEGLVAVAGHEADLVYIGALARPGYQVVRAAALALDGTARADLAIPALKQAFRRLTEEGRDNSRDALTAIARTLTRLGVRVDMPPPTAAWPGFTAADLRRFAAPRARITIRSIGTIDLALVTAQAPVTVLRFVTLARAGYYNGLTFHRVEPNFVIQGGSPGANEYIGDESFMRDEIGQWPHVRGAVGVSTRGRDTGDAQFFIDLVDNPSFDHEYTVFGHVLNGIDLIDRVLEGDVIESIDILQ